MVKQRNRTDDDVGKPLEVEDRLEELKSDIRRLWRAILVGGFVLIVALLGGAWRFMTSYVDAKVEAPYERVTAANSRIDALIVAQSTGENRLSEDVRHLTERMDRIFDGPQREGPPAK